MVKERKLENSKKQKRNEGKKQRKKLISCWFIIFPSTQSISGIYSRTTSPPYLASTASRRASTLHSLY